MEDTYRKEGEDLVVETTEVVEKQYTLEEIDANVANFTEKLAYWQNLKDELESLEVLDREV